jgi:hypothetical protein
MANKPDAAPAAPLSRPVILDEPITRGEQVIDRVTLRKPRAGELRSVALMDLAQLDVLALQRVLPRISQPTLTEADVAALCPADLLALGAELAGFFERKADKAPSPAA